MNDNDSSGCARIVSMALKPGTIEPAFDRFSTISTPLVRVQPGSIGILGLARRESPFGYAISFWESRQALERSNANPKVVEAMMGYADWMAGPFSVESYDIVAGRVPEPRPAPERTSTERARMTIAIPRRGHTNEVIASYRVYLTQLDDQPGCIGTLLLTPLIGQRIIAIELWSSAPPLRSGPTAPYLDRAAWTGGPLESQPVREILEVFGRF